MSSIAPIISLQVVLIILFSILLWLYSLKANKVSFIDRFWSIFFVLLALISYFKSASHLGNFLLIFFHIFIWAFRLSIHITLRSFNKPEDKRYVLLANKYKNWRYINLFLVFILQAMLAVIIALPITVAISMTIFAINWTIFIIGSVIFWFGFTFEAVADYQLFSFQQSRKSGGEVFDKGLWALCRHPNYFGEIVLWWGIYLMCYAITDALWPIISPLLITFLLVKVSGVPMLEKVLSQKNESYKNYIKETNSILPWFKLKK